MTDTTERRTYEGEYDDDLYWERVERNLGWLGETVEEQKERQRKLRDAVVGIAGVGGAGGTVAMRLARLGVRNLKLADPEDFDKSNIHRQTGASLENVGRNKAEVVAEKSYKLSEDINIDVFSEGITPDTAEEFMDGCDYVMDQMEFFQIANRYALHRAFRNSDCCEFMLSVPVVGHSSYIFKYTDESMPIEDVYGLPEDASITPEVARRLVERIIPEMPSYPSDESIERWHEEHDSPPIFGATPPLAEAILVDRLALAITGLQSMPGVQELPIQPGYAMFDMWSWTAKTVEGKWWDE